MRACAMFACCVALLPSTAAGEVSGPGAGLVTLATGGARGVTWALEAGPRSAETYCVFVALDGSIGSGGCGDLPPDGLRVDAPSSTNPAFVAGFVVSTARRVEISFSSGVASAVRPLTLPGGRLPGVAFFVAPAPCHTYPTGVVAFAKDGQAVARFTPPRMWRQAAFAACWNAGESPPPLRPGGHTYLQLDPGVEVVCLTPAGRIVAHVPRRSGDSHAELQQPNGTEDVLMVFDTSQSCVTQP
jgi:hypothetical protein